MKDKMGLNRSWNMKIKSYRKKIVTIILILFTFVFLGYPPVVVKGILVDSTTNEPLPGAIVDIKGKGWKKIANTDVNGQFSLLLTPGDYAFEARYVGNNNRIGTFRITPFTTLFSTYYSKISLSPALSDEKKIEFNPLAVKKQFSLFPIFDLRSGLKAMEQLLKIYREEINSSDNKNVMLLTFLFLMLFFSAHFIAKKAINVHESELKGKQLISLNAGYAFNFDEQSLPKMEPIQEALKLIKQMPDKITISFHDTYLIQESYLLKKIKIYFKIKKDSIKYEIQIPELKPNQYKLIFYMLNKRINGWLFFVFYIFLIRSLFVLGQNDWNVLLFVFFIFIPFIVYATLKTFLIPSYFTPFKLFLMTNLLIGISFPSIYPLSENSTSVLDYFTMVIAIIIFFNSLFIIGVINIVKISRVWVLIKDIVFYLILLMSFFLAIFYHDSDIFDAYDLAYMFLFYAYILIFEISINLKIREIFSRFLVYLLAYLSISITLHGQSFESDLLEIFSYYLLLVPIIIVSLKKYFNNRKLQMYKEKLKIRLGRFKPLIDIRLMKIEQTNPIFVPRKLHLNSLY